VTVFSVYYLAAIALAVADWRGRLARWRIATPRWECSWWAAILLIGYVAQLAILYASAQHRPWPIALLAPVPPHADLLAIGMLLLGTVQVWALVGLYRSGQSRATIVAGTAVMLALSLAAPVFANADAYAYVGNGVLGLAAYAPPAVPFGGELAFVNARWGVPLPAATYGPLWLAIARVLVLAPGLAAKLIAFRVLGAGAFVAMLLLLRPAGVPRRVVGIVALNPAFAWQFVADAHNDALALAMAVAAAAMIRRFPAAACGAIVAAALVKLPYAVAALPVLAALRGYRRYAAAAGTVLAALAFSWLAGGEAYAHALLSYARASRLEDALHLLAALLALAVVAAALAGWRRLRAAVWLIPMLGAYTAPWYAAWSVPYALARRRVLAYLAIWFPLVCAIAEPSLTRPWTLFFVVPVVVLTSL